MTNPWVGLTWWVLDVVSSIVLLAYVANWAYWKGFWSGAKAAQKVREEANGKVQSRGSK